jgi:hypothetical protein
MKRLFFLTLTTLVSAFLVAVPASAPAPAAAKICDQVKAGTPDIVYQGPTYTEFIAGTGQQVCHASWVGQQTCVKLREYNFGSGAWEDRTDYRCSSMSTGPTTTANITFACSIAGVGKYEVKAQGKSGGQVLSTATSNPATLCQGH